MERQTRGGGSELLDETPELVGESGAWRALVEQIPRVAASGLPVLLIGETGTGRSWSRARCTRCRRDAGNRSWRRTAAPRRTR